MVARAKHGLRSGSASVATVLARLRKEVERTPSRTEWVPSESTLGRVSNEPVRARRMLPPRDQSTMDGYAVRARPATTGRSETSVVLRVIGRSSPGDGDRRLPRVGPDTAVEILTGGAIPPGADAIVRSEEARRRGSKVRMRPPFLAGRDIARRGEDFRPGRTIILPGVPVRPWHVAALVANEIPRVRVLRRPRVGVLSTGDELVGGHEPLGLGRIRDTTKPMLRALLAESGAMFVDLGLVPDRVESIRTAVRNGLHTCDVIVTTGGSSVGKRDLVPRAIRGLRGSRWLASRVRLRPGSTTAVALVGHRPVFVLSGPPVAAFSGFVGVVEPFLRQRGGGGGRDRVSLPATLDRAVRHSRGVRGLVRVRIDFRRRVPRAIVAEQHGGTRLSSLTEAHGLAVLDEAHGDYRAGESVRVVML